MVCNEEQGHSDVLELGRLACSNLLEQGQRKELGQVESRFALEPEQGHSMVLVLVREQGHSMELVLVRELGHSKVQELEQVVGSIEPEQELGHSMELVLVLELGHSKVQEQVVGSIEPEQELGHSMEQELVREQVHSKVLAVPVHNKQLVLVPELDSIELVRELGKLACSIELEQRS